MKPRARCHGKSWSVWLGAYTGYGKSLHGAYMAWEKAVYYGLPAVWLSI